jgi:FkbM family methyltransferase
MGQGENAERVRAGLARAVLANHLTDVLARQRIDCVIDVGAHNGEYGRMLRGIGFTGTIYSFEPVRSSFASLEKSMAEDPSWAGYRLACGAAAGEMEMTVFEEDTSFSAAVEPTARGRSMFPPLRGSKTLETVTVRALDDLSGELDWGVPDPRILLKVDVQGQEWDVLRGAEKLLRRVRAAQVEASAIPLYEGVLPYTQVLGLLGDAGLELSGLFPVSRDEDLRILELDLITVRPLHSG